MGDCLVEEQKNIDMETKEELEFFDSWFELEAYSFKIISVITILADEQRAYRGTLNDFCEFLDIQKSSGNKAKIKMLLFIFVYKKCLDKNIINKTPSKVEYSNNIFLNLFSCNFAKL